MSIESDLVTALEADQTLTALVSTRIYPDKLPQNPTYPNIVYSRSNTNAQIVLEGRSGRQNSIFQFDIRAVEKADTISIADALKDAIETGTTYSAVYSNETDFPWEVGATVYRRSVDYSIWYS